LRLTRVATGEEIALATNADAQIGAGGEAVVLPVLARPELAAKIYHRPEARQWRKLEAMLQNPPVDPMAEEQATSIAWPLDRLTTADSRHAFAGYLMPRVTGASPLFEYYNPAARRRIAPLFSYRYLLRTARNLCAAVSALHERGYVIGDLNESNILVAPSALVTLVDTDSFQVPAHGSDGVFRCTVGKAEYTPPELSGLSFSEIDREQKHDNFALGVLIFQILMEGAHPFAGQYLGEGDAPTYAERIAAGHYPFGSSPGPYRPLRIAPPIGTLHPEIRALAVQCFEEGHRRPAMRPSASSWLEALKLAEEALIACDKNLQHLFFSHLQSCPWCARKEMLGGLDPFPAAEVVARGEHNPPKRRKRPTLPDSPDALYSVSPTYSASVAPPMPPPPVNPIAWVSLAFSLAACWSLVVAAPPFPLVAAGTAIAAAIGAFFASARFKGSGKILASFAMFLALWVSIDGAIDFRDVVSPMPVKTVPLVSPPRAVVYASNRFITGTERAEDQRLIGGRVQSWDPKTGKFIGMLAEYPGSVFSLEAARDDNTLVAAVSSPMEPSRIDLLRAQYTGSRSPQISFGTGQVCGTISPDGSRTCMGLLNGKLLVISSRSLQVVAKGQVKGEVLSVHFSPDARYVAITVGSPPGSIASGSVAVMDANTGTILWRKEAHTNAAFNAVYTPDGTRLLSCGADRRIHIWNAADGTELQTLTSPAGRVTTLALNREGTLLAAACDPADESQGFSAIYLYRTGDATPYAKLPGHSQSVTAMAFSANSALLGSVGLDMNLKIWRLNQFGQPRTAPKQ
jgi:serine/threonine protein kinase